jgi:glyoxylase-like metal-dependent hydrolase (beta-lactamase superfamily II)
MAKTGVVARKTVVEARVVSIGTLASHPLWMERAEIRTGHATCTLIRSGKRVIVVDPGLPDRVMASRVNERAGIAVGDVTHVFLTSFQPDTSRGIGAFPHATWWVSEREREAVGIPLARKLKEAALSEDDEVKASLQVQVAVLKRCEPAPDRLADGVDVFPLPGVTPGMTGVLVEQGRGGKGTLLVTGDAVATIEHLERGMVLNPAADVALAQESFKEAVEIADWFIPGRDNLVANPVRRGF